MTKEQYKLLEIRLELHKERNFQHYVCIGCGNPDEQLSDKLSIPREELYSGIESDYPFLGNHFKGDDPSLNYFIKDSYLMHLKAYYHYHTT